MRARGPRPRGVRCVVRPGLSLSLLSELSLLLLSIPKSIFWGKPAGRRAFTPLPSTVYHDVSSCCSYREMCAMPSSTWLTVERSLDFGALVLFCCFALAGRRNIVRTFATRPTVVLSAPLLFSVSVLPEWLLSSHLLTCPLSAVGCCLLFSFALLCVCVCAVFPRAVSLSVLFCSPPSPRPPPSAFLLYFGFPRALRPEWAGLE